MSKDNGQSQSPEPSSLDRYLSGSYERHDRPESPTLFVSTVGENAAHGHAAAANRSKENNQSQSLESSSLDRYLSGKYQRDDRSESPNLFVGAVGENTAHGHAAAANRSKDNNQQQSAEPSSLDRFLTSNYQPRDHLESTKQFVATIGTNAAYGLAEAANRSGAWIKEQVHSGLQDFVSRVLYGEPAHVHAGNTPEQEHSRDEGRDR